MHFYMDNLPSSFHPILLLVMKDLYWYGHVQTINNLLLHMKKYLQSLFLFDQIIFWWPAVNETKYGNYEIIVRS